MAYQVWELTGYEFEGADGKWHTIYQCSLTNREELRQRFTELDRLIVAAETESLFDLYDDHSRFRFLCDRCLKLCGVDPAWVSISQLHALLFAHKDGDHVAQAKLREANFPVKDEPVATTEKGQSYAELLAILKNFTGSYESAVRMARTDPSELIEQVLIESNKIAEEQADELKARREGKRKFKKLSSQEKSRLMEAHRRRTERAN